MGFLRKRQLISAYDEKQAYLLGEESEKSYAGKKLHEAGEGFSFSATYDIFLSHSYDDARIIKHIYEMLEERGYAVYVDWIEDSDLDRAAVTQGSAAVIRERMNRCRSLIYLTSPSAEKSVWMPWELGYMDARTGLVSIAPILGDDEEDFKGREYLGLYPYLDLTGDDLYIHADPGRFVGFARWMRGSIPA